MAMTATYAVAAEVTTQAVARRMADAEPMAMKEATAETA